MTGREQGAPKPIRHPLGTVTSAEGTRLSSSNRPDQAAKYGREQGEMPTADPVQREVRDLRAALHRIQDLCVIRSRRVTKAEIREVATDALTTTPERSPS